MSQQVTEAFVKQFNSNVFHLSQQKGSRLRRAVRNESQRGESQFFDRIGASAAIKKTTRHSDTPQIDTPHSRRRVTLTDYEWGDLIDDADKIRMLIDPESDYAMSAMYALGRSMDDEIIEKALADASGGQDGGTPVALGNDNKLAAVDGAAVSNLNVFTLRKIKKKMDENEVDESIKRYMCVAASQLESLLGETAVTSADFNTVKALVHGDVDQFMGFEFIRLERHEFLGTAITTVDPVTGAVTGGGATVAVGARRCFAWAQDGLLLSLAKDMRSRISERPDKSYSTQVYACMGIGSTRMEEKKVVEVLCTE